MIQIIKLDKLLLFSRAQVPDLNGAKLFDYDGGGEVAAGTGAVPAFIKGG